MEDTEGNKHRGKYRGEKTEGKRQSGRDRGDINTLKERHRGRDG